MGYIYKITNKINGKIYIGKTMRTIPVRWREHIRDSGMIPNVKPCTRHISIIHHAIAKYGVDSFSVEEVEKCDNEQLNQREKYWIEYYQSNKEGYNILLGGVDNTTVPDCDILKLWNEGYIVREISARIGLCDYTISRRLKNIGIPQEEILSRGNRHGGEMKTKPVYQYDIDGNFLKAFPSIKEAQESIGGKRIKFYAKRRQVTTGGFQWKPYKAIKIDSVKEIAKPRGGIEKKKRIKKRKIHKGSCSDFARRECISVLQFNYWSIERC